MSDFVDGCHPINWVIEPNTTTATEPHKRNPSLSGASAQRPMSATTDSTIEATFKKGKIPWHKKLVLVLVGLPARGKSHIANKTVGFLRWLGYKAELFNVGKQRREELGSGPAATPQDSSFFSSDNADAARQRDKLAFGVLDHLLDWLENGGDVAVFDATNTTRKRRASVIVRCADRSHTLTVTFCESICDDKTVLDGNLRVKAANSPDYRNMPIEEALADLRQRIAEYEKVYEPIADDEASYIKLINLQSKIICNRVHGRLGLLIAGYLMSIHIKPRPIYLVRAGHCEGAPDEKSDIISDETPSPSTPNPDGHVRSHSSRYVGHGGHGGHGHDEAKAMIRDASGSVLAAVNATSPYSASTGPPGSFDTPTLPSLSSSISSLSSLPSLSLGLRSVSQSSAASTTAASSPQVSPRRVAFIENGMTARGDRSEPKGSPLKRERSQLKITSSYSRENLNINVANGDDMKFPVPSAVTVSAALSQSGVAFSKRLAEFMSRKVAEYVRENPHLVSSAPPSPRSSRDSRDTPPLQSPVRTVAPTLYPAALNAALSQSISSYHPHSSGNMLPTSSSLTPFPAFNSPTIGGVTMVNVTPSSLSLSLPSSQSSSSSAASSRSASPIPKGPIAPITVTSSPSIPLLIPARSASPAMGSSTIHRSESGGIGKPMDLRDGPGPASILRSISDPSRTLPLVVYTSTLPRSVQTVAPLLCNYSVSSFEQTSSLNMLDTGACHGMSLDRIRRECPDEIDKWGSDKYRYRFPGGESQQDIAAALEPLVMELERQEHPILVVSHSSTMQVLYGYFLGMSTPPSEYYNISIPRNTVIELIPHQYGWQERRYDLSANAVHHATQAALAAAASTSSVPSSPWTQVRRVKPIFHGTQFYEQ